MSLFDAELQAFLEHPDRSADTLRYPELHGFLFAVANAPELILPSEWLPVVFGGEMPEYKDVEEAGIINTALIEAYNAVNGASLEGMLPPGCELRDDPMANLEEGAPIARWSRGFAMGYGWLEETWGDYLPDVQPGEQSDAADFDQELGIVLMVLMFFASPSMAESLCREMKTELTETAGRVHALFPDAVADYVEIARTLQQHAAEPPAPYQRTSPKVGRNERCPCGSGRKFKHCCGA